jgi:hypothetical protein
MAKTRQAYAPEFRRQIRGDGGLTTAEREEASGRLSVRNPFQNPGKSSPCHTRQWGVLMGGPKAARVLQH